MASWQDKLTSNKERLSYLYRSGEMSDVTFMVGGVGESKKKFRLHKFVLSMQSDVFFSMFYGSLPGKDQVEIIDIEPAIFEIVAKYFYEESFTVQSMTEAMETYCAAEKYNTVHLRSLCATFITERVSPGNIASLYRMPKVLEALKVQSKCDEILSQQTSVILKCDNFVKAPLGLVRNILRLEQLNMESEAILFQYVLEWAKAATYTTHSSETLRTVMDPFLPHIRFLAMKVEEFLSGPVRSGILTDSEKASILENLVEPSCRELPSWCNKTNTRRSAMRSFKLVPNHACKFLKDEAILQSTFCEFGVNVTKGRLCFRGVSFFVVANGTGEPKASLVVKGVRRHKGEVVLVRITEQYQSASSYDPNTSLMRCVLSNSFFVDCRCDPSSISVSLQDCRFKYCTYTLGGGTTIGNQDFEIQLLILSGVFKGHFYQIFYN